MKAKSLSHCLLLLVLASIFSCQTYQATQPESCEMKIAVNGEGSVDRSSGEFPSGSYTLTATPETGYEFAGWSGDIASTDNPLTVTLSSDVSVTANFAIKQYDLTVTGSGSGTYTLDPAGGSYDYGTVVRITAVPSAHWSFAHWSGDATGNNNPLSVTMNSDKSVTAHFEEIMCIVNVTTDGRGTYTLSPAGGEYIEGTTVTINAEVDPEYPGWQFSGWSGIDNASGNSATVEMNSSTKNVEIYFTKIRPEIGNVLCVNTNANGFNSGSNWADAYKNLADALAHTAMDTVSEIWVAKGTYFPTDGSDRTISFVISGGLKVMGGFMGYEKSGQPTDWHHNETILSGQLSSTNSINVVKMGGNGAIIDGFIITKAEYGGLSGEGAGIKIISENCEIRKCFITENTGSGIRCSAPNAKIHDCVVTKNEGDEGAGLLLWNANGLIISNSIFFDNRATVDGGAIKLDNGSGVEIGHCTIVSNICESRDGTAGISNLTTDLNTIIRNSIVWDNQVTEAGCTQKQINYVDTLIYSNIENVDGNGIGDQGRWGPGNTGNINSDNPNFVNETVPSISLADWFSNSSGLRMNTSVCINGGKPYIGMPGHDIVGNYRIMGDPSLPDMGAYEH